MDGSTELGVWGELLEQNLVDFGGAHLERREPWRPRAHTRAPGAAVASGLRGSKRAALSTLSGTRCGRDRLRSLGHLATRHTTRTHAPTVQHHLTMGSIFYCVAKGITEEILRLQAECGVESYVTDFYSGPLEEGDLVLQGQGPAEAGVRPELPRGRQEP